MNLTFDDLIEPTPTVDFCREYFARKTLFVRGAPDKFARLFSLARFEEILDRGWPATVYARAVFDGRGGDDRDPFIEVDAKQAVAAYEAGATICVNRLDSFLPDLAELCASVRLRLGFAGDVGVHAYWSPDGAGFRPHFDARIATTLQIDGVKTWRFGKRPVLPWPTANARIVGEKLVYDGRSQPEPWEVTAAEGAFDLDEVTLHPGDLLCLPAGTVHSAEATGSSLALNLHFNPIDAGTYAGRLLSHMFLDRGEWRCVEPLLVDGHDGARRALAARLREAASYLEGLADDASLAGQIATELVAAVLARPPSTAAPSALDDKAIRRDTPLRIGAVAIVSNDPLTVVGVGLKAEVPEPGARLLRTVLRRPGTTIDEVAGSEHEASALLAIANQMQEVGLVRR